MRRRKKQKPTPSPFAGLTMADCCTGCAATRCVISGSAYCGHPHKGGLQGKDLRDARAVKRSEVAEEMLRAEAVR